MGNLPTCFSHWNYADGITAIQVPGLLAGPGSRGGYGRTIVYLVEGSERALLLDTGFGMGDLRAYVEALTDKPLIVLNSHVHPDHSGGNSQWPVIYVGWGETTGPEPIFFPEEAIPGTYCDAVKNADGYEFSFLSDGMLIDLGDRTLEVIAVPGHTPGSITLLDSKTKMLLSGDALLKRVLLFGDVPMRSYRSALERLDQREISNILGAHWPKPLGRDHIRRMISVLDNFDPEKVERAPWGGFGTMCVFLQGEQFEDADFCAIGYPEEYLADLMS